MKLKFRLFHFKFWFHLKEREPRYMFIADHTPVGYTAGQWKKLTRKLT